MSTFGGKIQEIPQISIDRFDGINLESEAYFLSHCHTDHMIGLSDYYFQDKCVEENKLLYASEISCIIIKNMFVRLKNNVRELCLYKPTTIILKSKSISVIPIPAGHCPGSVMFLFENSQRILYTGDYRINIHDIEKFKPFYDSFGRLKIIDKIYLDTTFFSKDYYRFPKREESLENMCSIIKRWLDRGNDFVLHLQTSAKYGYEYLFTEIYEKIGMPIHVNQTIFDFYSLIPEMDKSVTTDSSLTRIHCSCGPNYQQLCYNFQCFSIKTMKVSALRWTQEDLEAGVWHYSDGVHYVCYSTHASYEEGVALIRFLKPKAIEACVQQRDPFDNIKMMNLLDEHLQEFSLKKKIKEEPKLFDISSMVKKKIKIESQSPPDNISLHDSPEQSLNYDVIPSTNVTVKDIINPHNVQECEHDEVDIGNCDDNLDEHNVLLDIIGCGPSTSKTNINSMKSLYSDKDVIYTIINS